MVDDRNNTVSRAYGLTFFPFTVFVDANGVVLGRLTGAIGIDEVLSIAEQVFQ